MCYKCTLRKSTVDTHNYHSLRELNPPHTEQIKFNEKVNVIANKYKYSHPKLSVGQLKSTIHSEPLPCSIYCLPKDSKAGDLKDRLIHAATGTPATGLSKYLTKSQLRQHFEGVLLIMQSLFEGVGTSQRVTIGAML